MSILEELVSLTLLEKSWEAITRGKSAERRQGSRGVDKVSINDFCKDQTTLQKNLTEIQSELKNQSYKFSNLKPTLIPKPEKEKDRLISIPTVKDRIVHRALLHLINREAYETINNEVSYCGIKADTFKKTRKSEIKDIRGAINKLKDKIAEKNFWVLESDITGFFDNINKKTLKNRLKSLLNPDQSINWLLEKLLNYDIEPSTKILNNPRAPKIPDINSELGIPQGSPISPLLSNIYLIEFDKSLKREFGDKYIRYADDFIILCKTRKLAKKAKYFAINQLNKESLRLEKSKTVINNLKAKHINFLGLRIDNKGVQAKKSLTQINTIFNEKILNPAHDIYLKKGRYIKDNKKILKINNTIQGFGEFYKYYHSQELFNNINVLIEKKKKVNSKIFQNIKTLDIKKLDPFMQIEDWQKLFN